MRTVSLAHLTVLDADPIALIEAGKAGGFNAVGLRIVPPLPTDPITAVVGDVPLQRRIKRSLRDTGMEILDIEAIWLQPDTAIESFRPALEVGVELGAKHVLTICFDDNLQRLTDNFGKFCALAAASGLRTMLEFIPYTAIRNLKSAHDLLIATRPADAGLLIDALHLSRSGGKPADLAGYDPALFSYVHFCDAPAAISSSTDDLRAEARSRRLYPGEGELWLDTFLDAFPASTPVAVEAPVAGLAGLPILERARLAGQATHRVLDRHHRPS
jgi:sugar phosphate isomerase/epimerase